MAGINAGRVIGGGLVAGLVMNVVDGVTNGAILGARWEGESKRLGLDMSQQSQALAGWLTYDFVAGIVLVWLYAAIRPRFGPGATTAIIACLALWLITHLAVAPRVFTGPYPLRRGAAS